MQSPSAAFTSHSARRHAWLAAVVLVSMATSAAADIPRGVGFLFSRERLNVAVSRARCLALVLASPRLLEVPCASVEELRLVNTLCHVHAWGA